MLKKIGVILVLSGVLMMGAGVTLSLLPSLAVEIQLVQSPVNVAQSNCRVDFRDTCSARFYHSHTYSIYIDGRLATTRTSSYIWNNGQEQIWRNCSGRFKAPYSPGTHTLKVVVKCNSGGGTAWDIRTFEVVGEPQKAYLDIKAEPSYGGSVTPSSGYYLQGSTLTLTATPATGWSFDHWHIIAPTQDFFTPTISLKLDYSKYVIAYFTSPNTPPQADFDVDIDYLAVTFTDRSIDSDGEVVSWLWDFGDGFSSASQNPAHAYASSDNYVITLKVVDDKGASDIKKSTIEVISQEDLEDQVGDGEPTLAGVNLLSLGLCFLGAALVVIGLWRGRSR